MLSHIRTQEMRRALPCGLFEGHTDSALLGNELSVCVCGFSTLRARFAGLCLPYSYSCLTASAPEPLLVNLQLIIFELSSSLLYFPQNLF